MNTNEKLAKYFEIPADSIEELTDNRYLIDGTEYLVLTDSEADDLARQYILDSLWAFNAKFIAWHTENGLDEDAVKALADMQSKLGESANSIVKALIVDLDHFVDNAIMSDGRGHFINSYDGYEIEIDGDTYAYKMD
jgi:hypothetical protein